MNVIAHNYIGPMSEDKDPLALMYNLKKIRLVKTTRSTGPQQSPILTRSLKRVYTL